MSTARLYQFYIIKYVSKCSIDKQILPSLTFYVESDSNQIVLTLLELFFKDKSEAGMVIARKQTAAANHELLSTFLRS